MWYLEEKCDSGHDRDNHHEYSIVKELSKRSRQVRRPRQVAI